MPEQADCRAVLEGLATDIREGGGTAYVLRMDASDDMDFTVLFDRSKEFTALLTEVHHARSSLTTDSVQDVLRQTRKLRKSFTNLTAIDFFPGEVQSQANSALCELELACARTLSPDEPHAQAGDIVRLLASDYQGCLWATRQRPWVDRLASAWLIRRFIDPQARLLWLADPRDCPADAISFDFDGARFSHVGSRVTFEVLAASFGLEQATMARLGLLVHYLDIGGVQPPEAAGVEIVLAGMRECIANDDELLIAASSVFDGLLTHFTTGNPTT
jgi:hypothetical protein